MGKFGITELLVILAIVILLFGTRKLKSMGSDVGGAIKSFRKSLKEDDKESSDSSTVNDKENSNQ